MDNTQQNSGVKDFGFILKIIRKRILLIGIIFFVFISMMIYNVITGKNIFHVKFTIDSILIKDIIKNRKDSKNDNEHTYSKWILENIIYNFETVAKERNSFASLKNIEVGTTNLAQSSLEYYRPINITLNLYDTSNVSLLIDGLITYINTNPYIKNCNELERKKLNTIKEYYNASIKETEPLIKNQINMQFNLLSYVLDLRKKIVDIDSKLPHYNGVEIVIDKITTFEPSSKNILRNFILFGILGLLTGIIIAIFIEKVFTASFI